MYGGGYWSRWSVAKGQLRWDGRASKVQGGQCSEVISSSNVRLANSKARIKPTAPLSVFDKENSMEFLLDFLHYLYTYLTLTLY